MSENRNQEKRNLFASRMIILSFSFWANGVITVRKILEKKFVVFYVNDVTIENANRGLKIDELLSRHGGSRRFSRLNFASVFC